MCTHMCARGVGTGGRRGRGEDGEGLRRNAKDEIAQDAGIEARALVRGAKELWLEAGSREAARIEAGPGMSQGSSARALGGGKPRWPRSRAGHFENRLVGWIVGQNVSRGRILLWRHEARPRGGGRGSRGSSFGVRRSCAASEGRDPCWKPAGPARDGCKRSPPFSSSDPGRTATERASEPPPRAPPRNPAASRDGTGWEARASRA